MEGAVVVVLREVFVAGKVDEFVILVVEDGGAKVVVVLEDDKEVIVDTAVLTMLGLEAIDIVGTDAGVIVVDISADVLDAGKVSMGGILGNNELVIEAELMTRVSSIDVVELDSVEVVSAINIITWDESIVSPIFFWYSWEDKSWRKYSSYSLMY